MKHAIVFRDTDNHWDNALPIGNGCFGAMLYFEEHELHMPMNHYEVYYNIREDVLPSDKVISWKGVAQPGARVRMYREKAEANKPKDGQPFCAYGNKAWEAFDPEPYSTGEFSSSYPPTGELVFSISDRLRGAGHDLTLFVEDATVELTLHKQDLQLQVDTIAARRDYLINRIFQSSCGLLKTVKIYNKLYRDQDAPQITYKQIDDSNFAYFVVRKLGNKRIFKFAGVLRLIGASAHLENCDTGIDIVFDHTKPEFYILTGIYTGWRYSDPFAEGISDITKQTPEQLWGEHKAYWQEFFSRSSICIPDKFLEHIYYVNQYALACCSGKDGVMKHQACGLNGLWDIRHPNLWGSMWYWDINIQAAFAGVFSSNRLDLAKVFSDGLLCHEKLAEQYANDVHGLQGVSIDYPFTAFFCIWPWCAQYLWQIYEYSLDEEFLRFEAYPLFLKLCRFAVSMFQFNDETDLYTIFPDISPEQGPITHDSTITIASIKYLLKFTLKSAEILGDHDPILADCREILSKMPGYAVSKDGNWGIHFNDSPDAPDNMAVRHPSLLMPLFPSGEYDIAFDSDELGQYWSNTIDFLEDKCEIGVFGSGWIAAAAARLGKGQTALRLLYEYGIDHMLRSNGLSAEETERFINDCLIPRQPLYYPCMMESTGLIIAAVNEMLLQSHNGLIRVFPALPDGDREWGRFHRNGWDVTEYIDRCVDYEAWQTVRFDRLLARGAFEISASLSDGKLEWILIHSLCGGTIRIASPYLEDSFNVYCESKKVKYIRERGVLSFDTLPNYKYLIAVAQNDFSDTTNAEYMPQVLYRESYTKRKIFLGGDSETAYHKAIDGFLRDWYLGNRRMTNHTLYKFDFTTDRNKVYTEGWTRQAYVLDTRVLLPVGFKCICTDNIRFSIKQGYGFKSVNGLHFVARNFTDPLRRDFVEGTEEASFMIELPRGQYELLVISGDTEEDSVTVLKTENWKSGGTLISNGQFQCEIIPIILKRDGIYPISISTVPGKKWKVNSMLLNVIKGY